MIAAELSADYAALAAGDGGRWNVLAASGQPRPLPVELLADALDRETVQVRGEWAAGPLAPRGDRSEALVLHWAKAPAAEIESAVALLLPMVREALAAVQTRSGQSAAPPPPGGDHRDCPAVEPHARARAAAGADGGGGHAIVSVRSGEHLPLGPPEPCLDRPPGPGCQGRRAPRGRRPRRRGPRTPIGPAAAR